MNTISFKTAFPNTKNLFIVFILLGTMLANAGEVPVQGPDITGQYVFEGNRLWTSLTGGNTTNSPIGKAATTIFYITKTGNGVHLEGEISNEMAEDQKKLSAKDVEFLTGDFIWLDVQGAFRNSFGTKKYYLYKVNDNTLALRNDTGISELGTFKKKEGSLGDLVNSLRNDVSGLIGKWNVEGTTASIGLTSGVKSDLNIRYGTSVYELNKEDGTVFETFSGTARSGGDTVSLQVVSDNRIKLEISGNTIYAARSGSTKGTTVTSRNSQNTGGSISIVGATANVSTQPSNERVKLLFTAIKMDDEHALDELLAQGININTKNPSGRTPLLESIYQNNSILTEKLLDANADINLTDNQGRSPLVTAIQKSGSGNMAMVTILLERRPSISLLAIDETIKKNDIELTKLLLDGNANRGQMAKRAIEKGKIPLVNLILDDYGLPLTNTLFDTALNNGKFSIADKMISKGFNAIYALDASVKRDAMDLVYAALEKGGNANTALAYAVKKEEIELAKLAVEEYRADPNKVLPAAVSQKNIEIVSMLLANKAAPNGQITVVSTSGDLQMLDLFLTNGADANIGLLPAAKANKTKAVQLLLQHGANANTLLDYAVENSNINYVNQSIQSGAQAKDARIMATAGAKGNLAIVGALLEAGANPNDAILPATKSNKPTIIKTILDAGADGTSASLISASAVHNNSSITKMFIDAGANAQDGMNAAVGASADMTLKLLIANGAAVHESMLLTTVKNNSSPCSEILMKQGISADMKDAATGMSLLHYSAKNDNAILTDELLKHNAPVDAVANGATPLHLAVKNRKGIATVDVLVTAGADVNALNNKGKSVLKIARGKKIKKLLKENGATK